MLTPIQAQFHERKALPILFYGDERLTQKAKPIPLLMEGVSTSSGIENPKFQFSPEITDLAHGMVSTMLLHNGVGLAAPQVGHMVRMIVVREDFQKSDTARVLINPQIVDSLGEQFLSEGCLSIPGARAHVKRAQKVVVRFSGLDGKQHALEVEDFAASVIQHEIDHLDGVLFLDHLGQMAKKMAIKKHHKAMRLMYRRVKKDLREGWPK